MCGACVFEVLQTQVCLSLCSKNREHMVWHMSEPMWGLAPATSFQYYHCMLGIAWHQCILSFSCETHSAICQATEDGDAQTHMFLSSHHINILYSAQDVKSKRSIGIHCCTMTISIEPLDEAPKVLEKEKQAAGIAKDGFITLQHGGMLQTADGVDLNKPPLMIRHGSS
jgi:hypothetical protein